ncbi:MULTISPECIES: nuclear transport factor 2 family protein [unclassified Curtobacterium]|uniref:nuclear transport factor 2 family protein n=1 Tax=unclassified Curtobacterium TaxID=257496 RepID=UPI0009F1EE35|nr:MULTISPECIES: nuclear transport factor 2 family protein [unclassified Curtobacterium]
MAVHTDDDRLMDTNDHVAIGEVLALVGHVFDDGRLDEIGSVFTADVVYDMSALGMPVITGIDGARAAAGAMAEHGPVAHLVTNVVVAGRSGDEATVDSKGLMLMPDGSVTAVVNHDVVRREPAGWRIAERRIVPARAARGEDAA